MSATRHQPGSGPNAASGGRRVCPQQEARRILIADDEETFRQTTAELLAGDGYQVAQAADGHRARELLEREAFDLVIADLKMPGNADLSLVRAVERLSPGVPVILVTGYPSIASAIAAYDLPVVAYLIKPFDYRLLLAHLRQALQERDEARERERLQQRLAREQARYQELFMAIPDAVLSIDAGARITTANRRAEDLFGYRGYELVGAPLSILLPERIRTDHADWVAAYLQRPHRRPMGGGLRITARHRSGREIPVDIQLSPAGEGRELQVLAIIRPIRELERTSRDLRERLLEQERRLQAAQRQREAMERGLSRLREAVARETLPALEETLAELAAREGERRLPESAGSLRRALLRTTGLARLAGQRLRREPLEPGVLACEILEKLERRDGGGVALTVEEGGRAFADPELVRMLLRELLEWGWGHAGARPGSRLEFGHRLEEGRTVFHLLTQRHGAGPCREGLEGTRLAHCREVVALHGGRIWRLEEGEASGCGYAFTLDDGESDSIRRER